MYKAIGLVVFLLFSFFLTNPLRTVSAQTESISLDEQKVIYQLPHPGMLPDHPLYFLKRMRDVFIEVLTRDNMKKAELYFKASDKHMSMALALAEKGKTELAIDTLERGENYFLKIPSLIVASKKQGVSPAGDFMDKLYQSNAKHKQVIKEVMKDSPQGEGEKLLKILQSSEKAYTELRNIK